jgi:dephospho-CoA kinase
MKIVAVVGMPGSGKSEVTHEFEKHGWVRIRFGDLTDEEIAGRGLVLNEINERTVRESLREKHGMAAYAILNMPKIETAFQKSNVVLDGLYSWEEYMVFKPVYGNLFKLIAVFASPQTRYRRLAIRKIRPLTHEQAAARDKAEIENINKGGPIAMADFTLLNETSIENLQKETRRIIKIIA